MAVLKAGTPEPGGWTTREVKRILRGLVGLHLVGADVVEVAPASSDKPSLGDLTELKSKAGLNDEEWTQLLEYVAQVFSNLVNYKSFGFTKFIPRVSEDKFAKVVAASAAAPKALPRWEKLKTHIYSTEPEASLLIGKRSDGHISNYYPGPEVITDEEATKIQTFVEKIGLDIENTRCDTFISRFQIRHLSWLLQCPQRLQHLFRYSRCVR
ncbi:hypothetical protein FRC12_016560 [Ceratobasidium sp. 428]|nr:hypothetical protein FRC12_016560 [Ceratobasidium sp. 428]